MNQTGGSILKSGGYKEKTSQEFKVRLVDVAEQHISLLNIS